MSCRSKKAVILLFVMTFAFACLLSACGAAPAAGPRIEKKTTPLVLQRDADKPAEEAEMNLYFVNGGDIPYVALSEYLPLFGSLYKSEELGRAGLVFNFSHDGNKAVATREDNECSLYANAKTDHLSFDSLDGFIKGPDDPTLVSFVALGENGIGGKSNIISDGQASYNRDGLSIDFDLAAYHIDLVESAGEAYLPLQTMNDILMARNYYNTIYNGDKVFLFAYGSELNDQILAGEPHQMSQGLAEFNVNELAFLVDNFYGLKREHGFEDAYKLFQDTGLYEGLSSTDPNEFDQALAALTGRYFDDLHSGLNVRSVGSNKPEDGMREDAHAMMLMMDAEGKSMTQNSELGEYYQTIRQQHYQQDLSKFENGPVMYEEYGDTAIVTFDTFNVSKDDYRTQADLDNPSDTIEIVAYAHSQITRKDSPVKNVILDLSCNGGGDADAAAFVISWFAGPQQLGLRDTLTGAQSICSHMADVNLDGKFDNKDTLYHKAMSGKLNLYCLTSPQSFSCGNLVPAAFKGTGFIKLLGETSGGGSCMVLPCTSASGAQFQLSGPMQISTVKNGSFYNVDKGIDPDMPIAKADTFYDREQLVQFIHDMK